MPYNLLLLPLLGGFLFIHLTHYFRFAAQRLDGYRLLIQAAIAGTCLAALARLIELFFGYVAGIDIDRIWSYFLNLPFLGTSAFAFVLGPVCAWIWNLFVDRERAKALEIDRHGNAFTKLLLRSQKEKQLLSVTLDNRKWYVGWITESPNLDPQELYFRLLPYRSGYRDKDNLNPVATTYYDGALREPAFDQNDLIITLPLKDVKTANLFNEDLYNDYFAEPPAPPEDPTPSHRHHES
ncbi:MAG TPA: hypothetical protein VKX25_08580 [Bryobacteraceae bacterium]|jgi:hypothetical protein|nr:hypothetical protein [Bryobacteraceae bacterium]